MEAPKKGAADLPTSLRAKRGQTVERKKFPPDIAASVRELRKTPRARGIQQKPWNAKEHFIF